MNYGGEKEKNCLNVQFQHIHGSLPVELVLYEDVFALILCKEK